MASLTDLCPFFVLLVFLVTVLIIFFYELFQIQDHSLRQSKEFISSEILEIIKGTSLFAPEFYERESVIEIAQESKNLLHPENLVTLPREITKYQFLLNPVRLSIMKILSENTNYESSDIRTALGISWGKYTSHLTALEKEGYIVSQTDFVESNAKKIISAEPIGLQAYDELKRILYGLVFQGPIVT